QLVKIGIDATLNPKESGAFYADAFAHNFDLMNHAVGYSVADPDVFISELYLKNSASNYGEYYNAQVEELFVKQSQAIDQGERRKLVRQIQDIFLKDHPNIIYFWQANWAFWWPEVRDWAPASSIYLNQKFQDVWLAQ
ncbi:MAG: hypothetical protein Q8O76_04415, partial [Chloroflexota bacterium]|nr:hypothetical protein [Chloroflexota bacterium]